MMLDVMQEVQPRQQSVQDDEGHWVTLRMTPYRTQDNRIDGVVLTVLDRTSTEEQGSGRGEKNGGKKSAGKMK
jgi:two-component system CheB/CheR fusion protein